MTVQERSTADGGMGPYSPQAYADHGIEEYRRRFPEETKDMSDKLLFDIVSNTDDDMDDDEWRMLFLEHATS